MAPCARLTVPSEDTHSGDALPTTIRRIVEFILVHGAACSILLVFLIVSGSTICSRNSLITPEVVEESRRLYVKASSSLLRMLRCNDLLFA